MPKYLIEVPHDAEAHSCADAARILAESGSHFLLRAEFGCKDGVHKGWIIVEVDSHEAARNVLHRSFRPMATVVELTKFSVDRLEELETYHAGAQTDLQTEMSG